MDKVKSKVVLLVEVNFLSGYLFGKYISDAHHSVLWVRSGEEALKICKNNPDIAMVIMDVTLPVMSGMETTCQIRTIRKDLPIVIHTPYSNLCKTAIECGCNEVINKTIDKEIMQDLLNKYLI